jgi:RNA polymerase subunit RPABC4/transcription elongation factor Spt4
MLGIDLDGAGLFTVGVVYGGMVLAAFWLAMILWTYRDMRSRSRDSLAQMMVAVMVAVLNFPGLLIYMFLRPRETLSEAYERSLEEEALLQEIEEKPACPGCGQRVNHNWQACAYCHTRLKKPCVHCGKLLELSWDLCPYCTANQGARTEDDALLLNFNRPATVPEQQQRISVRRQNPAAYSSEATGSIEFIDGDDYAT